jgi:hypothetical protein
VKGIVFNQLQGLVARDHGEDAWNERRVIEIGFSREPVAA